VARTGSNNTLVGHFKSLQVIPPVIEIRVLRMMLPLCSQKPESIPVNVSLLTGKPRLWVVWLVLFVGIEVHLDGLV
jgi:hypothetical protein